MSTVGPIDDIISLFMIAMIVVSIVGASLFIFLFWRRLKEDYSSDIIFSTSLFTLLGIGLSLAISLYAFSNYWFWISVLGASVGLLTGIVKYNLRTYEVVEAAVVSILPWLGIVFFTYAVAYSSLISLVGMGIVVMCLVLFAVLNNHYKRLSWYKSGRVGFAGITTLGVFFLARALVAIVANDVLSFIERYEAIVSAAASFICFFVVFRLARKTI